MLSFLTWSKLLDFTFSEDFSISKDLFALICNKVLVIIKPKYDIYFKKHYFLL